MWFLIFIGCILLGLIILVRYLEATSVFHPSGTIETTPKGFGLPYEDVYFKTADGVILNGWLIKNPKAVSTIIVAHGNAGNMSDRLLKVNAFYQMGLNVFIFDYRGYGKSKGHPTEKGIYIDGQAAYDYLAARPDFPKDRIIAYGASLGGAVAIDLATQRKVSALIVDSSFSSAGAVSRVFYPFIPAFLLDIKMDNAAKVKGLKVPKLFIHSTGDRTIPFALGQQLYTAAAGPKVFLQTTGGHVDAHITDKDVYQREFTRFLKGQGLMR